MPALDQREALALGQADHVRRLDEWHARRADAVLRVAGEVGRTVDVGTVGGAADQRGGVDLHLRQLSCQQFGGGGLAHPQHKQVVEVADDLAGLGAIADAADKYDVPMVKVTGGQRIDLLGVRKEHLPAIWSDLNAAGMVSGHAYAKGLRTVKTCDPAFASCTTLTNFNTGNTAVTQALLGAANATERDTIINWSLGRDLQDENGNANTAENRPSIHGDVVHSRPVAINYGTDASPQVVVFYGGNDGALRGRDALFRHH